MAIEALPIFCYYDQQRFKQFGAQDCANWYGVTAESGKKQQALYPTMGRKHVSSLSQNKLLFNEEPRAVYKTINWAYVVDGTAVYAVDKNFNKTQIGNVALGTSIWFAFLPVGNTVYAMMTDELNIYVITEVGIAVPTMAVVSDPLAPTNPTYVAAFGARFVVSTKNTPDFGLSRINLFSQGGDLTNCFTINGAAVTARASGVIGQMTVLHTQLYIFCDFSTDIWANISTQINVAGIITEFPWKQNNSYNFDYGIADPDSLDTDFGRMCWLAQNANGLVSFMTSDGSAPQPISSQAINVLLQNSSSQTSGLSPFVEDIADAFLYQYEDTIFYRVSAGHYENYKALDVLGDANSIEYNFGTGKWQRVIELNGERNRIQRHVYFGNKHLVTVQGDPAMYEMAGNIYYNELRNTTQTNPQAPDAFIKFPMRYELVTQQLFLDDYSEFIDDYVEIDFVFGNQTPVKSNAPFPNTVFIIDEESAPDGSPQYLVAEDGATFIIQEGTNIPTGVDEIYNTYLNPHIELFYSDDGGETFTSADLRDFSQLGQYRWRMRWYELSISRNRCYKLICVSAAPIVILGAVRNTRRASGGAN